MLPDWVSNETISLLAQGLILTIWMTAITSILSLAIGVGVGIMRLSNGRFRNSLAAIYIEVFRNVPALVLILFWAFAFPNLFPLDLRRSIFFQNEIIYRLELLTGISVPYYALAAGLALTLNTSAYIAELFRAGVGTIPQQYVDGYRTFGATKQVVLKQIIIPQGLLAASPAITTRLIHHMKNTTLAAVVSTPEFFHSIQSAITRSFRAVEFLTLAALVFLALSTAYSYLLKWLEKRLMNQYRPEIKEEGANLSLQGLLVE